MIPSTRVVATLLFGSGLSALVYQTAWQRMFRLSFGASTAASAAVLAIFLGGLGLGGLVLGKRVERSARPLAFYGALELGIALLAALSPLLAGLSHDLYLGLGGSQSLGSAGATVVRLALAALVMGPAAVLMGGTLPAAARAVVSESDVSRSSLALLYSLNTTGAVVGALVGPLLLFGWLGNQLTLLGAAAVNVAVGVAAYAMGKRARPLDVPSAAPTNEPSAAPLPGTRLVYAVAAAVGFVFLALELTWYRVLTPLLGGSSLTFGLILACALSGIGLGGYLFSRRSERAPASFELLGLTLSLEAACVLLPFAWGDDLALVTAHLRKMLNLGFGHLVAGWLFVAAVVVLPASIVSGYQFPALFSLLGRGRSQVGRQVGITYAFNTLGTLLGSLLAGFVLLPNLSSVALWRWMALGLSALGAGTAGYALSRGAARRAVAPAFLASLVALGLGLAPGPGRVFRHSPIGAGRLDLAAMSRNEIRELVTSTEAAIIWEHDGVESSVAISGDNGIAFLVNGKSDGSVVADRGTQAFLSLLPAALHGHVHSGFVVGLGTGMTAGLLGRVPGVERVDVAELEPSVLEVARQSRLANGNLPENPKVHLLYGDGRELLLTAGRRYDLIISEPSNPYRAGVASLFTREFYAAAASRLDRRGLFAQWLQGYEVDAAGVSIAIRTLREVFPHVSLWGPEGQDLILIASFEPQLIDAARLRQELKQPTYSNWMRRAWGLEGVEGLLAHHLVPPRLLDLMAASVPAPVNTDDVNVLEFAFGRSVGDQRYSITDDVFHTLGDSEAKPEVQGEVDWGKVQDLRHRIGWGDALPGEPSPKTRAVVRGCEGSMKEARKSWPEGAEPEDLVEVWVRGWIEAMDGDERANERAQRLADAGFVAESLLVRGRLAERRGEVDTAVTLLIRAFGELRATALPLCDATLRALRRAPPLAQRVPARGPELLAAIARAPFAIRMNELARRSFSNQLGMAQKEPRYCLQGLGDLREKPRWTLPLLTARAECLQRNQSPDAAAAGRDLDRYLEDEPKTFFRARQRGAQTAEATAEE